MKPQMHEQSTVELRWLERRRLVYHGLFELIFESLRNFSDSSSKQLLREIFLFYYEIVCCVYSLESSHFVEDRKHFSELSPFASWSGAMIKSQWFELPISRTISMVPKMFEPLKFDCRTATETNTSYVTINTRTTATEELPLKYLQLKVLAGLCNISSVL